MVVASIVLLAAGCTKNPYGEGNELELAEGLGEWAGSDLTCGSSDDCMDGETCIEGTCQIDRCNEAEIVQEAIPPMGQGLVFLQDQELAVADRTSYEGSFWVDAYQPVTTDGYDWSVEAGTSRIVDIAGGRFDDSGSTYVAAVEGDQAVLLLGTSPLRMATGFVPVAVDAGDVDGDGYDEVVAVAQTEEIAICHADTARCDAWVSEGTRIVDVAVGDIDGDSFEEPVLLVDVAGERYLYAFHPNAEHTGEDTDYFSHIGSDELHRITSGDLDGDWIAEVIALKEEWWCGGLCDDQLHTFDAFPDGTFAFRMYSDVENQTGVQDLAAGDIDNDDVAEVITLSDGAWITVQDAAPNRWNQRFVTQLSVSSSPNRIATGDHDGDAPRAELVDGPTRKEGAIVPLMVMTLPPYHRQYSNGKASVGFGDNQSQEESMSDTVSLTLNADVGVSPSFFGLFGTRFSAKVDHTVSNTLSVSRNLIVGNRYNIVADPDKYGPNYGAVVVGWGCFDAYLYKVHDPAGKLGGDGEKIVVTVPVGGGDAMYNSARYNAMAEALGGLPKVEIPYTVGDPSTYPTRPERLDGKRIDEADLLFPEPAEYTVSDVGDVGWWNMAGKTVTNSQSTNFGMGASAGITAFGVSVGVGVSQSWGSSYGVSVGSAALFWGNLPALPDDLSTPEDEYAQNRYSVIPWIYQDTWEDEDGNEAAYWVMTYEVGD